MRIMLITAIVAYIFGLGYFFVGRMGRCAVQGRTSSAKRRESPRLLLPNRPRDAAVAERIRRFQRDHRRMQALLYDAKISELPVPAD